jgi:hypothetical protein
MTISTPKRLFRSDSQNLPGLFEPTTVEAVWRVEACSLSPDTRAQFLNDWADFYYTKVGQEAVVMSAPFPGIEEGIPANRLATDAAAVPYETVAFDLRRVTDSSKVWEVTAKLQLLEAIPARGHAMAIKTVRTRSAQAWRADPFASASPDPSRWVDDDSDPVALDCTTMGGLRIDVNGQPVTVLIDQHVTTISFVIRAPYYDPDASAVVTPSEWTYWTTGSGAKMVNNRNDEAFWSWPAYSLVLESIQITQIGSTTFHRVDVTMVHDQWWHLDQLPVTFNGAQPPTVSVCEGKIFQTRDALWLNPYVRYSDFNDFIPYIPIDSRTYLQDAAELTGGVVPS